MEARCARCHHGLRRGGGSTGNRLASFTALAALMIWPLAISLPVLRLQRLGHINEASIWSGAVALLEHGQWLVGIIVIACSIVIPLAKLLGLLYLGMASPSRLAHHRARLYRWIELLGRWGMVDVLLVAVVVAALKMGDLVEVQPGPGVIAFTTCVLLSLLAAAFFDPHRIWETEDVPTG
jgi:paraquat-inducible protein A